MLDNAKNYFFKVRWMIVVVIGITFMAHGSVLFSQRFGIDTENIMKGMQNFSVIGRQGLLWLQNLLNLKWFNLYYAQVLTFAFMAIMPIAFGFLLYQAGGCKLLPNTALLVMGLSVVVSPFWVSQIYFLNQSAQVLLACILVVISIILAEQARIDFKHKWYGILLSIGLMQMIFASYQVLIMVYITGVVAVFLTSLLIGEGGG